MKHSTPKKRSCGKVNSKCRLCGSTRGMITKYKLNVCRRCFRQFALKIGFRQYK
ncbi:30S ribosomal protein S14 [Candidatus Woesearchaeota archaeon]|nr:30S ribosomal protein S14 [Candidatus Woesearchaeota archaeon]